jgi:hypothetical protein
MKFNFAKAIEATAKEINTNALGALVMGGSGGGKSFLTGTLDVKTLYLYALGEDHGPKAAKVQGGDNIVPLCFNYDEGGKLLADEDGNPRYDNIYQNILNILTQGAALHEEGFEAIVVDGVPELEAIIRGSDQWAEACKTNKGQHNTFSEGPAVNSMLRPIFNLLKDLQRNYGMHYVVTMTLDVQAMAHNGAIEAASPQLSTYAVAETVARQFGDILVVGRMSKGDEVKHKIQFMSSVSRASKDQNGFVKKAINFTPRLSNVPVQDLPPILDADLKEVIKLKTK